MRKQIWRKGISLAVTVVMLVGLAPTFYASASQKTAEEYQQEIKQYESKLEDLQNNKGSASAYQSTLEKLLETLNSQLDAYQRNVEALEDKVTKKEIELSNLNDDILKLESDIAAKEEEIAEKEIEKSENVEQLKIRLKTDYMSGKTSALELLMDSSDFGEFLSSIEYIRRIAAYDQQLADALEAQIEEIETVKKEVEADHITLSNQKEQMENEMKEIAVQQNDANQAKTDLQNIASDIQKRIKESKTETKRLEAIAANASKAASTLSKASSYEYTGGVAESSTDSSSSGGWGWPVPGYSMTSGYGMRGGSMHYGLDFPAPVGTNIVASKGGTVIVSTYGVYGQGYGGFGNVVVIDHGDGYTTLYAHMSERLVSVGATVNKGQVIGEVGNTGSSSGSHLHLEVRTTSGTRLNPSNFIK